MFTKKKIVKKIWWVKKNVYLCIPFDKEGNKSSLTILREITR